MAFDSGKGLRALGVGVVMMAFGYAGLNSAHAGEMVELSAGELRQVDGGGISPLLALSSVVGPLARAGGNAAGRAASSAAKTGEAAALGGGISLAQYLAANQGSLDAREAALAAGSGALVATLPKSVGILALR